MNGAIGRVVAALAGLAVFYAALVLVPRMAPHAAAAGVDTENAALVQRANQLIAGEHWSDALAPVMQLVELYPRNHIYDEHLATIYRHLDRPADEAAAWEKFIQTSPNAYEACPQMGDAYRRAGDMAKAIDAHERCMAFDPRDPDLVFYAAHAQEWKDDWIRAKQLYEQAAAINPDNMDVQIGLGRVALHDGDPRGARAIAERVLQRGENPDAYLLAGMAATASGDITAARDFLTRGLAQSPNYADLRAAIDRLPAVK